jgi:pyruvate dehydrogenase E2 component (dihydrolipoamide acetyltransferase)
MDFLLPKLSATMETAKVSRWLKTVGDSVRMGEPLIELETDKTAMEVESPVDAILEAILAAEGDEVPIGEPLARFRTASDTQTTPKSAEPATVDTPAPIAAAPKVEATAKLENPAEAAPPRVLASPLAKHLAGIHGVDISALSGSGPNGRVRKRDVLVAAGAQEIKPGAIPQAVTLSAGVEQLSTIRRAIAQSVALSRRTIPSFVLDRWVETVAIDRARTIYAPEAQQATGVKLTFTDFLLQAMADSLAQTPRLLDRWYEEGGRAARVRSATIDIGLVVALADGVMIPVLRDLKGKTLGEIASARQAAVQRARSGRPMPADSGLASISLSNIGKGGADRFEAIINPEQTAILAVGREHEKVVARSGAIAVGKGVNLTLSVDHRLIDGIVGAEFLGVLADRLELGPWSFK